MRRNKFILVMCQTQKKLNQSEIDLLFHIKQQDLVLNINLDCLENSLTTIFQYKNSWPWRIDKIWALTQNDIAVRNEKNHYQIFICNSRACKVECCFDSQLYFKKKQGNQTKNGIQNIKCINNSGLIALTSEIEYHKNLIFIYDYKKQILINQFPTSFEVLGPIGKELLLTFDDLENAAIRWLSEKQYLKWKIDFKIFEWDLGYKMSAETLSTIYQGKAYLAYEADHMKNHLLILKPYNIKGNLLKIIHSSIGNVYHHYVLKEIYENITQKFSFLPNQSQNFMPPQNIIS